MKIVHVEDFVHPDAGYQLNSLAPLQARQGHEVTIVSGELDRMPSYLTDFFGRDDMPMRDRRFALETGVEIVRIPLLGFYSGRAIFHPSIFRRVTSLKPDVVFVHGEDTVTGIAFIILSRWLRYPLVLDCHMLEMASLNKYREYFRAFYRRFVTPVILKEKIPLIRVVDSDFVEKCLNIPLEYTDLLSFGTDTLHFCPNLEAGVKIRKQHGIDPDAFVILYAGKLDETKGGKLLANAIREPFPELNGRKVEFLIIGNGSDQYGHEVEAILEKSANRITRLPTLRFRDLAGYYQAADLAAFPKQCSMSFFEIQSCGVPILFEDNEINRKRVVSDNAFLFQPDNGDDFRKKMIELGSTDPSLFEKYRHDSQNFVLENYDYVPVAQKFTDVLSRAIASWRKKGRRTYSVDANAIDGASG